MPSAKSLWPADLVTERPDAPVAILREQAQALWDMTASRLAGRVDSRPTRVNSKAPFPGDNCFRHRLIITVPALQNYEVELLSLIQGVAPYPLLAERFRSDETAELDTEEELLDWLRDAFSAPETRELFNTLLSVAA